MKCPKIDAPAWPGYKQTLAMSTSMTTLRDTWGNEVEVTRDYISYRNRLVDMASVKTVQVKNKRMMINNFYQNACYPTMCIFFTDKEKAEEAFSVVKQMGSSIPDLSLQTYSELALQKTQSDGYAFIWLYWAISLGILAFSMAFGSK